ncbi:MAG TPA: hypothetical protein VHA10_06995 [Hypericibacter adhaerens]|uniref:hypothetical protein n=1 Tax=Hypericibacter adhaerens TaxID=2602016 RepID=UPI002CC1D275|nr:hypothetical protein [Hypericibacter adhaerens]HWA42939.1 hypothetical protein [Hypericibacter adhaerens]
MNALFLIVSVVLPLLPVVLFPTRFIGRGVAGTLLGAGLLVGMMMLIYWGLTGVSTLTGDLGMSDNDASALASATDADMSALQKLLGN